MREPWTFNNKESHAMVAAYDIQSDDKLIGDEWLDSYPKNSILDAKCVCVYSIFSKSLSAPS